MKKAYVYAAWGFLYILCVILGFAENPVGLGKVVLIALGILFFLPPTVLLVQSRKENSRKTLLALRLISVMILSLSLILLILNFLSVYWSAETGNVLYVMLVMFTAPMECIQFRALGLFLWACLLFATMQKTRPCQR